MKNKPDKKKTPVLPKTRPNVPAICVTLLVGIAAAGMVIAQFHYAQDPASQLSLANLNRRVALLKKITNLVQRDRFCIPLAAYGRALDEALPTNARIFMSGMVGEPNDSLGYYFFLRNYLFPRDVEISLDGKAVYHDDGFSGIPCDSPAVLKTNGFDLMIQLTNNRLQLIPLTPRGVPKSE